MLRSILLSILFLLLASPAPDSAAGAGFDPITDPERALTRVPWQPDAPAVVLFVKAELKIRDYPQEASSWLDTRMRIKILREEGREYAEVAIPHSAYERLRNLEGRTVQPDGRIVPLGDDDVFQEQRSRAKKRYLTKMVFPAVEVGSIIDYRFRIYQDDFYFLDPWTFHNTIPTLLSEVTYKKPGNLALDVRMWETAGGKIQTESRSSPHGVDLKVWMENLIGIPEEPNSFPFADLASRFMIVPKEIRVSGSLIHLYDSWRNTRDYFEHGDPSYRRFRNNDASARARARELASAAGGRRQQLAAIHAFVRDEIRTEWSNWIGVGQASADKVLAERKGRGVEKALLLQVMLDAVGAEPALVWAADKRLGRVDLGIANPWWFEDVLVMLDLDGERLFLDPADRSLGFGRLAPHHQGTPALLLGKKPEVISLPRSPFDQNRRRAEIDLALDAEGRFSGSGSLVLTGHHAWRYLRFKDGDEATAEAWNDWLRNAHQGYEVSDLRVRESIEDQSLRVEWRLEQRPEEVLGDEASLTPSRPLGPLTQPFALPPDRRRTPVQLAFADRDAVELRLSWPAGWEIDVLPEGADVQGPAGALLAGVVVDEPGRQLTYTRRFDVTGVEFVGPQQYSMIRELYREVESHDAQSLVLVRP